MKQDSQAKGVVTEAATPEVATSDADATATEAATPEADVVAKNSNLTAAKKAKNDEFYTQWADIEREMNAYVEYDPDVFRDKVVLLPCDDPEWSNFTKFFALRFADFGIKRLISTFRRPIRWRLRDVVRMTTVGGLSVSKVLGGSQTSITGGVTSRCS